MKDIREDHSFGTETENAPKTFHLTPICRNREEDVNKTTKQTRLLPK